jgi:hypothetical protein
MKFRMVLAPTMALLGTLSPPSRARAQSGHAAMHHGNEVSRDSVAVMATALTTTVSPSVNGRARSDVLVTQPMLTWHSSRFAGRLRLAATLNGERWTMPGGEPVAGIWGEGFIDRRHPHTVLHELMVTAVLPRLARLLSVSVGRGFVPFGTDDPMVRPFTKYPANHHLSQIMERMQLVVAVRPSSRVAMEAALFNGDEPASPTSAPQWNRIGDSRSARLTVWPRRTVELQGSIAAVRSPEFVRPDGLDHRKVSLSARMTPQRGHVEYAMMEWARTAETYRGRSIVAYGTALAEACWRLSAWRLATRIESTSHPEDERLLDPFRTARPPNHLLIQGMTRWRIASAQLSRDVTMRRAVPLQVFAEVARAHSTPLLRPVLLNPADISGADVAWHFTAGVRVSWGVMSSRVGRYGLAAGSAQSNVMLGMAHTTHQHTP